MSRRLCPRAFLCLLGGAVLKTAVRTLNKILLRWVCRPSFWCTFSCLYCLRSGGKSAAGISWKKRFRRCCGPSYIYPCDDCTGYWSRISCFQKIQGRKVHYGYLRRALRSAPVLATAHTSCGHLCFFLGYSSDLSTPLPFHADISVLRSAVDGMDKGGGGFPWLCRKLPCSIFKA